MPQFKVTRLDASDKNSEVSPRIELGQVNQLKTLGEEEDAEYRRHGVISSARNSRKLIYLKQTNGPGSGENSIPSASSPQATSPNDHASDGANRIAGAFLAKGSARNSDHLGSNLMQCKTNEQNMTGQSPRGSQQPAMRDHQHQPLGKDARGPLSSRSRPASGVTSHRSHRVKHLRSRQESEIIDTEDSVDISELSEAERREQDAQERQEQERVIADMARKRSSVPTAIKVVKEKEQEHQDSAEGTPAGSADAPAMVGGPSPDAVKFDNAGLKDLEQKKSSMTLGGQHLSFEHQGKIQKLQNVSELHKRSF